MRRSHQLPASRFRIAVFLLLPLFTFIVYDHGNAQQPIVNAAEDRDRGIKLYQQGDAKGAIEALRSLVKRHKKDISAWHYLGLALGQLGKRDDARKAHEKSAKYADELVSSLLDRFIRLPKTELLEAADSAEQYLALSVNPSGKKTREWFDRAEFLRVFAADKPAVGEVYSGKNVTTKPRVLSKPEPTYTEEARQNLVTGTVILRVVFAADGHVRAIHVVAGLPNGLTRRAIIASQRIKFIPATKDGRPVSMWMELQYNFNLY